MGGGGARVQLQLVIFVEHDDGDALLTQGIGADQADGTATGDEDGFITVQDWEALLVILTGWHDRSSSGVGRL